MSGYVSKPTGSPRLPRDEAKLIIPKEEKPDSSPLLEGVRAIRDAITDHDHELIWAHYSLYSKAETLIGFPQLTQIIVHLGWGKTVDKSACLLEI